MGRRGPRPTPTPILKMRGSWLAKARAGSMEVAPSKPSCPKWLNLEAKRKWRDLIPRLAALNVLTHLDAGALARYCQLWARWRACEEYIEKYGQTYPEKDPVTGAILRLVVIPQVNIAKGLLTALARLEQEFGLTPSARSVINTAATTGAKQSGEAKDKGRFFKVG